MGLGLGLEEEGEEGFVKEVEVFLFGAAAAVVVRRFAAATIKDDDDDGRAAAAAGMLLLLPTSRRCGDGVDVSVCLIASGGGKESRPKREKERASERRVRLLESEGLLKCGALLSLSLAWLPAFIFPIEVGDSSSTAPVD